jgi:predicted RNase H-like nuclease (RuvC/YqgF family)
MPKLDIDQNTVDKWVGKRVAEFNKTIRTLEAKLQRRDKQIQKLKHEVEVLKGQLMHQGKEDITAISKVARHLVTLLQEANLVEKYYDAGEEWTADEYN